MRLPCFAIVACLCACSSAGGSGDTPESADSHVALDDSGHPIDSTTSDSTPTDSTSPPPSDSDPIDSSTASDSIAPIDSGKPGVDSGTATDSATAKDTSTPKEAGPGPTCGPYAPPTSSCGVERWTVKVGDDYTTACAIDLSSPTVTTIAALTALPSPGAGPAKTRIAPTETTAYLLKDVTLTAYKLETDSDYHLVLQDSSGRTMIAEIPSTSCMPPNGSWAKLAGSARAAFDAKFSVGSSFKYTSTTVSVMGIGFFDVNHGQKGVAPNAIELHPVLGICFTAGCTP